MRKNNFFHLSIFYRSFLIIMFLILPGCQFDSDTDPDNPSDPHSDNKIPTDSWIEMGPAPIGKNGYTGRISAIAVSSSDPNIYYVGGADGGVWKSTNSGISWVPLTDHLPTTAIGALAVNPSNHDIIYAGSGEANFANHSRYGLGIYKTTDGGSTWQVLARNTFAGRCFSRLVINPTQTDELYAAITHAGGLPSYQFNIAAAKGHPGATLPLGVWKSINGGGSWSQLNGGLPGQLSVTDLIMDPINPSILYAAIGDVFGNAQNGVYKTTDGGKTWNILSGGLPTGPIGRIALAISPSNSQKLYASIVKACDAKGGSASTLGVYRSNDGGLSWTFTYPGSIHATYGWYLNVITVDPANENVAFVGGVYLYKTSNGGNSWLEVGQSQHIDFHALTYDASGRLLCGNDGGVYRSQDSGATWAILNNNLGIIQFYAGISLDPNDPDIIYGGTQDNGTLKRLGVEKNNWKIILGGDGGYTGISPNNSQVIFSEYQGTGNLYKSNNGGNSFSLSNKGINLTDPNCFLPPFTYDPNQSHIMYYTTNRVYKSNDEGFTWSVASDDLTNGKGAAIRSLAISPSNTQTLYASTNDGRVLISYDGAATWHVMHNTIKGWPRIMRQLAIDPIDPLSAYLAVPFYGEDQILVTPNGGQIWSPLDNNLPDIPVNAVALDPRFSLNKIYLGTDSGVYVSIDNGATWNIYGAALPNCAVIDIVVDIQNNRIIVATQGRGMWQIGITDPD